MEEARALVEDEVVKFIREWIGSVYGLDLLLMMMRHPGKAWEVDDLVRELRSSRTAVTEALNRLMGAGMVSERSQDRYAFVPASPRHQQIADAARQLYRSAPISVMRALATGVDRDSDRQRS
jgi:DNA-binding GntR family transcriptional regulator